MSTNYDIIRKLIGLQGIEIVYSNANNGIFEVFATSMFDYAVCSHCGYITYTVDDKRYQSYKHLPIQGMDTVVMLEKKTYAKEKLQASPQKPLRLLGIDDIASK